MSYLSRDQLIAVLATYLYPKAAGWDAPKAVSLAKTIVEQSEVAHQALLEKEQANRYSAVKAE